MHTAPANISAKKSKREDFRLRAKTALVARDLTITALARSLGFNRNTVSIAINHPTMLPTVKQRIREALKIRA